jgi:hypothetical protein
LLLAGQEFGSSSSLSALDPTAPHHGRWTESMYCILRVDHGMEMRLEDNSDQYESMQISFADNPSKWTI